jgi:hypothetical protein
VKCLFATLLVGAGLFAGALTAPSAYALGNQSNLIGDDANAPWTGANSILYVGDSISYIVRHEGNAERMQLRTTPRIRTTDDGKGEVLRLVNSFPRAITIDNFTADRPLVELYRWRTLRPGSAVIEFVDDDGEVTGWIDVTVKPDSE